MDNERIQILYYKGKPTSYFISDHGNLYKQDMTPVKQFNTKRGYKFAVIVVDGSRHLVQIHRCVAMAFLTKPSPECTDIDHLDANKENNVYTNLEFVTPKENHRRAAIKGLYMSGENHSMNKYTNDQIRQVCELLENPKNTYEQIEKITGVHRDTVYRVASKTKWRSISSNYDFSNRHGNQGVPLHIVKMICVELEKDPQCNCYELARRYGVDKNAVYDIKYRKSYKSISKSYNF